jgi:hypothetical protein
MRHSARRSLLEKSLGLAAPLYSSQPAKPGISLAGRLEKTNSNSALFDMAPLAIAYERASSR